MILLLKLKKKKHHAGAFFSSHIFSFVIYVTIKGSLCLFTLIT
jgi:hypothetical protein